MITPNRSIVNRLIPNRLLRKCVFLLVCWLGNDLNIQGNVDTTTVFYSRWVSMCSVLCSIFSFASPLLRYPRKVPGHSLGKFISGHLSASAAKLQWRFEQECSWICILTEMQTAACTPDNLAAGLINVNASVSVPDCQCLSVTEVADIPACGSKCSYGEFRGADKVSDNSQPAAVAHS